MSTSNHTAFRSWISLASLALLPACTQMPRTAEFDHNVPQLTLNGHVFHTEAFGDPQAPVVIVLHGGPGADYRYLLGLSALSDQFRVVFYDQLGSGLSQRVAASEISPQRFIDDLDAIVVHYGAGKPVMVVGHSWGAMLASAYAGQHPEKISRMVLAEPGFLDSEGLHALKVKRWPGWGVIATFTRAWFGKWRVSTRDDLFARDDWFLGQVMPVMQSRESLCNGRLPPLNAWRFGSPAFNATLGRMIDDPEWAQELNFARGLDQFHGRVMFLRGECNREQDEQHQRQMMAKFSAHSVAELQSIPNAGHFMFNDQPEASMAAVRKFLSANESVQ